MNDPMIPGTSPFDAIRRVRDDGSEYWTGRELQPLMGYARWENFETPLNRAMAAARGQQFGLTEPQAFQLLRDKKVIYRQSLGWRWSNSAGRKVEEFEHRPYAGRQSFGWFDLRPQHNAPRHHNGQVRQTLYVRQSYALDLGRAVGIAPKAAA